MQRRSLPAGLIQLLKAIQPIADKTWLVGGTVRDLLLGRELVDFDLLVKGDFEAVAERTAKALGGRVVELKRSFQTRRVVWEGEHGKLQADLTSLEGKLEADLAQRDFTLNALAVPLEALLKGKDWEKALVDPFGGRQDLDSGLLKAVALANLSADPVRLMRAVRLAVQYGLEIGASTADYVRAHCSEIELVPGERLREELFQALAPQTAVEAVQLMDELGLLEELLPELAALKGLPQNQNHHLDAYEHTLEAVRQLVRLTQGFHIAPELQERVFKALQRPLKGGAPRVNVLIFALLWHDVGKPETSTDLGEYGYGFPGHRDVAVKLLEERAERLKLAKEQKQLIETVTAHHLDFHLALRSKRTAPSERRKFFKQTAPYSVEVILACVADRLAARGKAVQPRQLEEYLDYARQLLEDYFLERPAFKPPSFLSAQDLMDSLELEPGPAIALCLEALEAASADGLVTSRQEALAFAARFAKDLQDGV